MIIEHVCLNVVDIEKEREFYCSVFGFKSNEKYHNAKTGWENYFLFSEEGGARLELLFPRRDALKNNGSQGKWFGPPFIGLR